MTRSAQSARGPAQRPARPPSALREARALLERREFSALKALLARSHPKDLAAAWKGLKPMEKAVLFRLHEPGAALELFRAVDGEERYFLLCAFQPGSIAPVLEGLPEKSKALFARPAEQLYEAMVRLP